MRNLVADLLQMAEVVVQGARVLTGISESCSSMKSRPVKSAYGGRDALLARPAMARFGLVPGPAIRPPRHAHGR